MTDIATSRAEARQLNLKFYHGKSCVQCSQTCRYRSSGNCVSCSNIQSVKTQRISRAKNPEFFRTKNQQWYKNNKEQKQLVAKKWRKNNPAKVKFLLAKRRALKASATPTWVNSEDIQNIYILCPDGYEVDHIVPLNNKKACGLHVAWNLRHLPAKENRSKSNKLILEDAIDFTAPGWLCNQECVVC